MQCPRCQGTRVVNNGRLPTGKPQGRCPDCRRQGGEPPEHGVLADATNALLENLLLERVSLAGRARVPEGSERWRHYDVKAH